MTRLNLLSPGLVESGGRLSKPLADFLAALASTTTDAGVAASITDLLARVEVLEGEEISLQGFNGITIYGSAETGYQIHGDGFGPIAAQVFGS